MIINCLCNPWKLVITNHNFFVQEDLNMMKPMLKNRLFQHQSYPEPYSGDPNSKVICLNLNPGAKDAIFESVPSNMIKYAKLTEQTLLGKAKGSMWYKLKSHSGYCWLMDKTRELWKHLGREPKIFMIEYFPYHTPKGFNFPKRLPSYQFSDCLIREAMENGKIIIIMRHENKWYQRIPALQHYSKLIVLKSSISGRITQANIDPQKSKVTFQDLLNAL